ncbi:MAG: methyltransferase [Robiginitomaculum sp.]|nr:MAG: methyltransferase [Robiginitomaculum sp.]
MSTIFLAQVAGVLASGAFLAAVIWSIAFPQKCIWPPQRSTFWNRALIWVLTVIAIGSMFWLGLTDWNAFGWSAKLRWGLGLPLMITGNIVVFHSAAYLGYKATSGAKTALRTHGFYRYSRNPQYTADLFLFTGWAILSASIHALPVIVITLLTLLMAPSSEEPWLRRQYGKPYEDYCRKVRRFL